MSIYTIYQITNNVNNKIYIGVHKTDNPYDCYMGSGRAIRNAIAKYGVSNFTKTILFTYDNAQDAFAREAEIVTEEFISSDTNYNCKVGGRGGWDHVRDDDTRKLAYERKKEALIDKYGVENVSQIPWVIEKTRATIRKNGGPPNKGKKASPETRKKLSTIARERVRSGETKDKISQSVTASHNKKYHIIDEHSNIETIVNLKRWCKDKNIDYNTTYNKVDKGLITFKTNQCDHLSHTKQFLIGKEIRTV